MAVVHWVHIKLSNTNSYVFWPLVLLNEMKTTHSSDIIGAFWTEAMTSKWTTSCRERLKLILKGRTIMSVLDSYFVYHKIFCGKLNCWVLCRRPKPVTKCVSDLIEQLWHVFIPSSKYSVYPYAHGFYIMWMLISLCARMMLYRSFPKKKSDLTTLSMYPNAFNKSKCLLHMCA